MKILSNLSVPFFVICLVIISCEPDNNLIISDPEFSIKFSDGMVISEKDIVYYDSSTCNLFLKNNLHFKYVFGEPPNVDYLKFSVFVDTDTIYQGIVYPADVAQPPPNPCFIASYSYPYEYFDGDIISIRYPDFYSNIIETRHNNLVINSLEKSSLLKKGITCSIDSIYLSSQNDSIVTCVFTIKNHDVINYYIPDPVKMGFGRFSLCLGGLSLKYKEKNDDIYVKFNNLFGWEVITIDDLSLLNGNDEVTFTYESLFNKNLNPGLFECRFYYCFLIGYGKLSIPLAQEAGRIWAGDINLVKDNMNIQKQ